MASTAATGRRAGLDHDDVVDGALALVEREGPDALTMRRLASSLGVTPTTIYWHAGNREALVLAVIRRLADQRAEQRTARPLAGATAAARITAIAVQVWRGALEHPHVTALAYQAGAIDVLEHHAQQALATELAAAGLRGRAARDAMAAILLCVAGFIVAGLDQVGARPPDRRLLERTVGAIARDLVGEAA